MSYANTHHPMQHPASFWKIVLGHFSEERVSLTFCKWLQPVIKGCMCFWTPHPDFRNCFTSLRKPGTLPGELRKKLWVCIHHIRISDSYWQIELVQSQSSDAEQTRSKCPLSYRHKEPRFNCIHDSFSCLTQLVIVIQYLCWTHRLLTFTSLQPLKDVIVSFLRCDSDSFLHWVHSKVRVSLVIYLIFCPSVVGNVVKAMSVCYFVI